MDKSMHGDQQFDNFYYNNLSGRPGTGSARLGRRSEVAEEENEDDPKQDEGVLIERATSLLECGGWDMDAAMQV
jgi:hypothetical protein